VTEPLVWQSLTGPLHFGENETFGFGLLAVVVPDAKFFVRGGDVADSRHFATTPFGRAGVAGSLSRLVDIQESGARVIAGQSVRFRREFVAAVGKLDYFLMTNGGLKFCTQHGLDSSQMV